MGVEYEVVAPSLIPKKSGDRIRDLLRDILLHRTSNFINTDYLS
jgi:hypothetical protein